MVVHDDQSDEVSASPTPTLFPQAIPMLSESSPTDSRQPFNAYSLPGVWWITALCGVVALLLIGWSWYQRGPMITVSFRDGHGLKVESRLLYRGVEVGNVERIELGDDMQSVKLHIRLLRSARLLPREESLFWIERPTLSLGEVRGLDTIVGGRYIAMKPGDSNAPLRSSFVGLEQPLNDTTSADDLEVILEGTELRGLQVHAPVIYRGLRVGYVQAIGLSADSRWIQVRVAIQGRFRSIIRDNTRFWNRTGFKFDLGLSGLNFDVESLAGVMAGGIELATPDPAGPAVNSGQRFPLGNPPNEAWDQWQPRISNVSDRVPLQESIPTQERLTLRWQESLLGFRNSRSKTGWCLAVDDGRLIVPKNLVSSPESALANSDRIELAGKQWEHEAIAAAIERSTNSIASVDGMSERRLVTLKFESLPMEAVQWQSTRLGGVDILDRLEDSNEGGPIFWITHGTPESWIPVEVHQIRTLGVDEYQFDSTLDLDEDHHGAAVIDGQSGRIAGMVFFEERVAWLIPL